MESTRATEIGKWTTNHQTFEQVLSMNTESEQIYFIGGYSCDQDKIPYSLMQIIEDFIGCWKDSDEYELSKVTLHNFYQLPSIKEEMSVYPGVWRHFSHTGCVIVFNPNDIDLSLQLFGRPENYSLAAGEMIFIKTNAKFCYIQEKKSSKLKHIVVYSFVKRV